MTVGYAMRRDWPDGTHDLVRWHAGEEGHGIARRAIPHDQAYWRRGPIRPVMWTVVRVSRNDWEIHKRRHGCQAPDCPKVDPYPIGVAPDIDRVDEP